MPNAREEFQAGYRDAKIKSPWDGLKRGAIHGAILAVAIVYPAAIWKRVVGALVAFWLVGMIVQYRAMRRERSRGLDG